jgi:hypothetical protein
MAVPVDCVLEHADVAFIAEQVTQEGYGLRVGKVEVTDVLAELALFDPVMRVVAVLDRELVNPVDISERVRPPALTISDLTKVRSLSALLSLRPVESVLAFLVATIDADP